MKKPSNRWLVPVVLGSTVSGLILWAFVTYVRLNSPAGPARESLKPSIVVVSSSQNDRETRELTDLDPLFLPTRYNTSVLALPTSARREPGSMSFTFQPRLSELESRGGVSIADSIPVPARPIEVLSLGEAPHRFSEFGRSDVFVPQLVPRLAGIEVFDAKTGRSVLSEDIPNNLGQKPPAADWVPVQFLVAIDSFGVVGSPVATNSSASEDVENFFSDYLEKTFSVGARLTPGFYTVHIGP